jgi:hypothetical protein
MQSVDQQVLNNKTGFSSLSEACFEYRGIFNILTSEALANQRNSKSCIFQGDLLKCAM